MPGGHCLRKSTYDNNDFQDELDAEMIYSLLENEVAPLFYFRDDDDIPTGWIRYIKNSIAKVASSFTTKRMLPRLPGKLLREAL